MRHTKGGRLLVTETEFQLGNCVKLNCIFGVSIFGVSIAITIIGYMPEIATEKSYVF